MSRKSTLVLALLTSFVVVAGVSAGADEKIGKNRTLLSFKTMFGVDGAFVGDAFPLGGFEGDEFPWEIERAIGKLDTNGNLSVVIKGLVFGEGPEVPPELRGINDEAEFRAAVVCLTEENGAVAEQTVVSGGFPATVTGNSLIRTHLVLPDPCVAPIVLVLSGSEDAWFAATGFETEEEQEEGD